MIERSSTGIEGFDKLCQGGFVKNSSNIIIGGPGSGKTTFLLQFLYNGATKFGENGIYCSFEPDIVDTLNDGASYGWDLSKLNEEGKVKFMKFSPETSIEELKAELTKLISQFNVRRICFDPVSVLALGQSDDGKIRGRIFDLVSLMKRLNVTSVLADESGEGSEKIGKVDVLKFLGDGVVFFHEAGISNLSDRSLRIAKMRRTAHARGFVGMKIGAGGIEVVGV